MGRPLWFVAGAGLGVYAAARARRAAESFTADGLRDRVEGLRLGARLFREEVEQGRVEKETELRARLGLVPHGRPELTAGSPARADGNPGGLTGPGGRHRADPAAPGGTARDGTARDGAARDGAAPAHPSKHTTEEEDD